MGFPTEHHQPVIDTTFTGIMALPVKNIAQGATLIAILNVLSFTGGVAPSIALRMFNLDLQGVRVPAGKINGGGGAITAPGQQILVYGPDGANSIFGDDKNSGALPRNVDLSIDSSAGDQTSTSIQLDVIIA